MAMDCAYCDVRELQQIEKALLHGLAAACLERSAGDLFSRPMSLVSTFKEELVHNLQEQQQKQEQQHKVQAPCERIMDMVEAFVASKRNFLGKVLAGLSKQDNSKVEEMVCDLEKNNLWPLGQREVLAKVLLKQLDITGRSHCVQKFDSPEELAAHMSLCIFRPLNCENAGCNELLSALHLVNHDSSCSFKLLPCKLKCDSHVTRGDMDTHCSTVCPMKPVNCDYFNLGCRQVLPQCKLQQHLDEFVSFHLLLVLRSLDKHEDMITGQAQRVSLLEKAMLLAQRSEAVDVGWLSLTVKEQDKKIKDLEAELKKLRTEVKKSQSDVAKMAEVPTRGK